MLQEPSNVMERRLGKVSIPVCIIKDVFPVLEKVLVKVHSTPRLPKKRFGHESNGLTKLLGCHFGDILDDHGSIPGKDQTHHGSFDLRLSWSTYLVVMIFHRYPHFFQMPGHFGSDLE